MNDDLTEFRQNRTNHTGLSMRYASLSEFLLTGKSILAKGPVAMIFVEDSVEVESTIHHAIKLGFRQTLVFSPEHINIPADVEDEIHRISYQISPENSVPDAVNQIIEAAPDVWFYYGYNAEYLHFPFCETRTIGELLAFNAEERRRSVLTYVVDLYAPDLYKNPDAINLEDAHIDKSGYYALARTDKDNNPLDRQLDFFGGLRWRFEEHVPNVKRKIDRISIFRAKLGLNLLHDHTFNEAEYNTYECAWHHSITATLCSFRTAKALKRNPGSTFDIETFWWHNSVRFDWNSQQLLNLGLMEPGQWF